MVLSLFLFQIIFYEVHTPGLKILYHYHYNEIHPSQGVHKFFLNPVKDKLMRVRAFTTDQICIQFMKK